MDQLSALNSAIDRLVEQHGSLRAVGKSIGLDVGYLSKLKSGKKSNPSDETLKKLGLVRAVYFIRRTFTDELGEYGLMRGAGMSAAEAIKTVAAIEKLRENEGDSVEIWSANPEYDGAAHTVVAMTAWNSNEQRFEANTLVDALESAVKHKGES